MKPVSWVFFGILMFGTSSHLMAQIGSKSYKMMLGTIYKNSVPLISCDELKKAADPVLLDTRAKPEYDVSHLKGARWVGHKEFTMSKVTDLPKDTPIVVYCSVGYRSERIGEQLLAAGYTNVKNLNGSIFEWINQGNPIVDKDEQPTNRVHAYSKAWGIWVNKGEKVYD